MVFPEWIITVIPVSIILFIAFMFALCYCSRFPCKRSTRTQPAVQNTDGPIHDPGYYNNSFRHHEPAVFTIPGSAFMPYSTTGLPVNYVISTASVITITSETDDENEGRQDDTIRRARSRTVDGEDSLQYDNGVTLSVDTLPSGPPQYGSLYFCPPPDYEEALEIQNVNQTVITHL